MACVATSAGNVGASAPRAVAIGAAQATNVTTRLRPIRSASTAAGSASTMPARTIEPATPTPQLPTPKSSAANLTVWVNSVLMYAELIDAAASSPRTRIWRSLSRSGGAHHGFASGTAWWWGWCHRRPTSARTGSANSQLNHGIEMR